MSKPIVTALASYGMSGQVFHAPFIEAHEGFQLKYILERTASLSKLRYPQAIIVRSFEDILKEEEVELVVVNTPNQLHAPMAKQALQAGKHVVVEKPFSITVNEGKEVMNIARQQYKSLNIYHNKRFEGEFKTVRELIKNETLGRLISFETRFDRYRPEIGTKKWKEEDVPGAGLLYDLGPHMIDQVLVLFGWPNAVTADLQKQREGSQVIDYFHITLHYDQHDAIVTAGMFAQGPVVKYLIKGDNGVYTKYGADPQEALLKQGISPTTYDWGKEASSQWGKITNTQGEESFVPTLAGTYMDYYEGVYQTIRAGAAPLVRVEEALDTIGIIELALASQAIGGTQIEAIKITAP
ncbi:MAG TPA: Gfo/Idh/MocA family oxidoreductase [Cytophagaceae bacterium]|jgi:scyllo-inositol 2-dehydrogenase (NADP+)|nr:Gfo/Idh/MocA family oxidoreductase [Cytophagaceae bacterium]